MTSMEIEVSRNIKKYRKLRGITQKELASMLGVKDSTVCCWEIARNAVDIETLAKICKILDVTMKEMYGPYGEITDKDLTPKEKTLISAYRDHPEIQHAVDLLLGLSDTYED